MKREQLSKKHINLAFSKLENALAAKIRKKGMGAWASRHEVYGFLAEERYELMKALHENHHTNFEEELIDVAVCCIWGLATMGFMNENEQRK